MLPELGLRQHRGAHWLHTSERNLVMSKNGQSIGFDTTRHLSEVIGTRFAGTPAEARAADYVAGQFRGMGYSVREQTFRFLGWEPTRNASLRFLRPEACSAPVFPFIWSDATPPNGVEGRVERVGRMNIIGLFEWDKYAIVDTRTGEHLAYLAARDDGPAVSMAQSSATFTMPLVAVGRRDLQAIRRWEASEKGILASLTVGARFKPGSTSRNIIAALPGREPVGAIVLCAHYDSEYNTPGAYDNACGLGLIVEVAARLRDKSFRRPIHFIAFGAEEYLYVGADYYVTSLKERGQLGQVAAAVNVDSILIPDSKDSLLGGAVIHHTQDHMSIDSRVQQIAEKEGLAKTYNLVYESPPSYSGDHAPFVREGIPAVKLLDAAPTWFHTPLDTLDRIDRRSWEDSVLIVQQLVEELADTPD